MSNQNLNIDLMNFSQIREISHDFFAKVYLIEEKGTGNFFAAQIVEREIYCFSLDDSIFLSHEINFNAGMNHPSIIRYIGYSQTNFLQEFKPVIVTEYCTGGYLNDYIENHDKYSQLFDDTKKLILIFGIASGMKYLHANGIIHCDLKTKNICIDNLLHPKIWNFFMSEKKDDIFSISTCTRGTLIYMAPEVFDDSEIDKSRDVYAFGIVLYEILTGTIPFKNLHQSLLINEKRRKDANELFEYKKPIEKSYRDLIERCCSIDPEKRPTFDEIVEELKTEKFITEKINEEDYLHYINFIENYPATFENCEIIRKEDFDYFFRGNQYFEDQKFVIDKEESTFKSFFSNLFGKKKEKLYPFDEFTRLDIRCKNLVFDAENDATLQFDVGRNLIEGKQSFPVNINLGVKYLETSISGGNIESVIYLCRLLIKGSIIPQDLKRAKKIILSNINKDIRINTLYGKLLYKQSKFEESLRIFKRGIENDDPESMYNYAKMLIKGLGCEKDIEKAKQYLTLSKNQGFKKSEVFLESLKTKPFEMLKFLDEKEINDLQRIREISSGGGGHVYEVFNQTKYALKVMNTNGINVSKMRSFIGEYEKILALRHPNIVIAHGIFIGNETIPPSILLEFCPSDLNRSVREEKLSNIEVAFVIYQIAEGMKHVHNKGIIHRDLKPSNILIGSDKRIRISDFGISKLMNVDEQSTTFGAGTQKFMAPEILNEEVYDAKSDVYSFGVLLFFILSQGEMPRITVVQMGNGKKAEIPSEFTSFGRSLIDKCWNFDPKTRPSFEEIVHEMSVNNYKVVDLTDEEVVEVRKLVSEHKKRIPKY